MSATNRLEDLRGPQRRIARLLRFYPEAYLHMLFYRIAVPLTLLYAVSILLYLLRPGLGLALKIFTAVLWVLWTPQLFAVAKGLALAWSRGRVFGQLNPEFAALYRKRYPRRSGFYRALPYAALALWVLGYLALLLRWQP